MWPGGVPLGCVLDTCDLHFPSPCFLSRILQALSAHTPILSPLGLRHGLPHQELGTPPWITFHRCPTPPPFLRLSSCGTCPTPPSSVLVASLLPPPLHFLPHLAVCFVLPRCLRASDRHPQTSDQASKTVRPRPSPSQPLPSSPRALPTFSILEGLLQRLSQPRSFRMNNVRLGREGVPGNGATRSDTIRCLEVGQGGRGKKQPSSGDIQNWSRGVHLSGF